MFAWELGTRHANIEPVHPVKTPLLTCVLATAVAFGASDAGQIVRKSLDADNRSERLRREYTYRVLERTSENGKVHSSLCDVLFIAGRKYEQLLEKDGRRLSPADAKKEQDKIDRAVAESLKLLPEERRKRVEQSIERSEKRMILPPDIPDGYDFTLEREVELSGRPAWQIHVRPKTGHKGNAVHLPKVEGTLWIDKADYAWARVDVTTLETFSVGLLLFRLSKGSHLIFENMKVNDELWAIKRMSLNGTARVGMVKMLGGETESLYSGYRRFRTDSRLLETEETH